MARSLRERIESVVFAGLKPGTPRAESKRMSWLGPLRGPIERFLSGGPAPSDPLYLSSRTPKQRFLLALKVAVPFALAGGIVLWAFRSDIFPKNQPKLDLSPAELAAKFMPDVDKIRIVTNHDVEVPAVGVDRAGHALTGTVKNNTPRTLRAVEVTFDVTDENGSKLGAAKATFASLAPRSESEFRLPIQQAGAAIAVVREIQMQ
jgi:hypothetical protein